MTPTTNTIKRDDEIRADVVDELACDTRLDASKVRVTVDDGVVRLSGAVPTIGAHCAAEFDAWTVLGVTQVVNETVVRLPDEAPLPADSAILNAVDGVLKWNPDVDATGIDVTVEAGIITLTGTVPNHWQKLGVRELVEVLGGVRGLHNELAVAPMEMLAEEIIAEEVVAALGRNVLIDAPEIDVTVIDAGVALNGRAPSYPARVAATRAASRTAGVVSVENNLIVRP